MHAMPLAVVRRRVIPLEYVEIVADGRVCQRRAERQRRHDLGEDAMARSDVLYTFCLVIGAAVGIGDVKVSRPDQSPDQNFGLGLGPYRS